MSRHHIDIATEQSGFSSGTLFYRSKADARIYNAPMKMGQLKPGTVWINQDGALHEIVVAPNCQVRYKNPPPAQIPPFDESTLFARATAAGMTLSQR